jgi:hypothetical protein
MVSKSFALDTEQLINAFLLKRNHGCLILEDFLRTSA